jgi:hypothetical protein
MLVLDQRQELRHAFAFFLCVMSLLIFFIVLALHSSGPIILGTERNTNGLVEYLCLGSGCDGLNRMNW